MIKVGILGTLGRMGWSNLQAVFEQPDMEAVAVCEAPNHPRIGENLAKHFGVLDQSLFLQDAMEPVFEASDVVLDFTLPLVTSQALEINQSTKKAMVIGTTGLSHTQFASLQKASEVFPIVYAPNFSVGINVLMRLVEKAAAILSVDNGYDLEILEAHHRYKADAPSGTAIRLAEIAGNASGRVYPDCITHDRWGSIGARSIDKMGVFALRMGDVIGEHSVIFSTLGERIELTHKAHTRDTFSKGALLAVQYIHNKTPGFYSIQDVLNLKALEI